MALTLTTWLLAAAGCSGRGDELPPPPVAEQTAGGEAGQGATGGATDDTTGEDTALSGALPWPTESNIESHGDMTCDAYDKPCNHQVMIAVDDGAGWQVLDFTVALRASVPDATYIDHGEVNGIHMAELRVYYVDEFVGNLDGSGGVHIISTASLAFSVDELTDAASASALLTDGARWVYRRTNLTDYGDVVVDPNLEVIQQEDGDLEYVLVTLDLKELTASTAESLKDVLVFRSDDGLDFELVRRLLKVNWATDPDPFPLDFDGLYPGVLPAQYGLGGAGRWGMHLSQGDDLDRYDGDLSKMSHTGRALDDVSVSGTALLPEGARVYAHNNKNGMPCAVSAEIGADQTYGEPVVELEAADSPLLELGVSSPGVVPLPGGLRLMFFHTRIDEPHEL